MCRGQARESQPDVVEGGAEPMAAVLRLRVCTAALTVVVGDEATIQRVTRQSDRPR